jgi:BioD-like phosphotransacetylase family protein
LFASSPGRALSTGELESLPDEGNTILEADAGAPPLSGAAVVLVARGEVPEDDADLGKALGSALAGTIATDVPKPRIEQVARDLTNAGLRPLAVIPEDRTLAAPSVGEIRDILEARVLYDGENAAGVIEDVLVAPVYADPAQPHFLRFESKAVLAPFNKTDLHLAAIETQAACLIITGGGDPSPYVIDRAQGESTTVLLTGSETPATLAALSNVWLGSRFRGERKADAIFRHLEGRLDFTTLLRKIGQPA